MKFRNELKYIVDEATLFEIEHRISTVLKRDVHQKGNSYNIRSIYFDDVFNTCMKDNAMGVDRREKYRIRVYDKSSNLIKAEIKGAVQGKHYKRAAILTKDDFNNILELKPSTVLETQSKDKQLFVSAIVSKGMRQKTLVEYERTCYVTPLGNVRITFDRNINASTKYENIFSDSINGIPVMKKGYHILEVKYDEFIPAYLTHLLELGTLQRTSFSKYYIARQKSYI